MKYESNVLKRLIDTYGVVGNPRYISEIIKEFIVQGKECYPNLFTYQSDWLAHIDEFGLNPSYTVSYTGQSFYAPNTLERPVKSAILKGSTKYRDIDTGEVLDAFEDGRNLELVSVRMPVLTTTGKNLFDISKEQKNITINIDSGKVNVNVDTRNTSDFIKVIPNTHYICNVTMTRIAYYDKYKQFISLSTSINHYINIPSSCNYVRFSYDNTLSNIQFEQGSTATSYEPYKSNILTVNEDVTLRGNVYVNGELKEDTLDLVSGEHSISVGEAVLNGSENWSVWYHTDTLLRFMLDYSNMSNLSNIKLQCDKIPSYGYNQHIEGIYGNGGRIYLIIDNSGNKLLGNTINDLKTYLSQNPITVQYPLKEKSIKTVDLNILDQNGQSVKQLMSFNGGTHFNTTSSEGSPLPVVSVSVETDLEEVLMLCSLEGNTL